VTTPSIIHDLADEAVTTELARRLAAMARVGDVIALTGDLGAGKTSFARAFVRARANAMIAVPSPTFTLVQTYDLPSGAIWHFDLYRLNDPAEAEELGIDDAFADAISLIEWPDRLGARLPADRLDLTLAFVDGTTDARQATLAGGPSWADRLASLGRP
jgi:tRNA threonylcarbamoyladenosine biosynthesis protein TsaE